MNKIEKKILSREAYMLVGRDTQNKRDNKQVNGMLEMS